MLDEQIINMSVVSAGYIDPIVVRGVRPRGVGKRRGGRRAGVRGGCSARAVSCWPRAAQALTARMDQRRTAAAWHERAVLILLTDIIS